MGGLRAGGGGGAGASPFEASSGQALQRSQAQLAQQQVKMSRLASQRLGSTAPQRSRALTSTQSFSTGAAVPEQEELVGAPEEQWADASFQLPDKVEWKKCLHDEGPDN